VIILRADLSYLDLKMISFASLAHDTLDLVLISCEQFTELKNFDQFLVKCSAQCPTAAEMLPPTSDVHPEMKIDELARKLHHTTRTLIGKLELRQNAEQ